MKRLMFITSVGLSLVLLMPLGVAAQEPVTLSDVPDPTGDVQGTAGPMLGEGPTVTVPGPDYLDITALRLEEDGSDLVVTFELAGEIVARDPAVDEILYTLLLRPDAETYIQIETRRSSGWQVESLETRLTDGLPDPTGDGMGEDAAVESASHGTAARSPNRLVMRVPRPAIGSLDDLDLVASASAVRDCSAAGSCDGLVGAPTDPSGAALPFAWWQDVTPDGVGTLP
jgi:hypothetical protein